MVTPIQETPSLTLSESDMQVATEENEQHAENGHVVDPLLHRLKEQELEGSDNVSTSNDELPHEPPPWDDPLHRNHQMSERRLVQVNIPQEDITICPGLTHPIDFSEVVSIPGWVTRGAGASTHHEYEVRIVLGGHARWLLLRRYRRFRELYLTMRRLYGPKVASIPFPARQLWSSEAVARARRSALESFLRRLLAVVSSDRRCPFYDKPLTRETLVSFSPFFRKGVFESGKCGTG